jgi:Domain of unknown function (DUF4145)
MPSLSDLLDVPRCPHCGIDKPHLSLTSNTQTDRHSTGGNPRVWRTYACRNCGGMVLAAARGVNGQVIEMYPSGAKETFELEKLPSEVAEDFREALDCYSNSSFNAFGAMARRTVQSISANLGAKGSDKVLAQLKDLKEMAEIDEETFDVLKQVIIGGHDAAHPHLPKLSPERAAVLLELMKDVLYQVYIRKTKVRDAIALRNKSAEPKK